MALALLAPIVQINEQSTQSDFVIYVGTYGTGVYGYRFNAANGSSISMGRVAEVTNPSFLATDSGYRDLYAVSELDGAVDGKVASFAIDPGTAALKPLNTRSSQGQAPCYVSVDRTGRTVLIANYGTGGVAVFPVDRDGSLGEASEVMEAHGSSVNADRQAGPHAHEAVLSPDNRYVYVPDLGLDEIRIYKLDSGSRKLSPGNPPFAKLHPGNGPRHIALTTDGKFAYVVNELKSVVTVFARDLSSGVLTQIQEISTLPPGSAGESAPAEILLDRTDRFVYVSNRGPGTIAVFAIAPEKGTLTQIQIAQPGGTWPRGVAIDPTGRFLFAGDQKANLFVLFRIDPASGKISLAGKTLGVPSPVSFVFVPSTP